MISRRLIRIKVLQILYAYTKKTDDFSALSVEKELFHSIDKFYDLYLMLLLLMEEITEIEKRKIEIRQNNLSNEGRYVGNIKLPSNKLIEKIYACEELHKLKKERKLNWKAYDTFIKVFYKQLVDSDLYKNYINLSKSSFSEDKDFVKSFFSEFLISNDAFIEFLEDNNIYWNDDIDFAVIMLIKNIDFVKQSHESIKIFPIFKNDDDKDYAKLLIRKTIVNYKEQLKIIENNTKNWDTERIADIDLLILQIAITELFEFNSIPVKVTMNEYIEIAKYYSTNRSNVFINGVLDRIIKKYEVGKGIKKTGRGLIE